MHRKANFEIKPDKFHYRARIQIQDQRCNNNERKKIVHKKHPNVNKTKTSSLNISIFFLFKFKMKKSCKQNQKKSTNTTKFFIRQLHDVKRSTSHKWRKRNNNKIKFYVARALCEVKSHWNCNRRQNRETKRQQKSEWKKLRSEIIYVADKQQ